MIEDVQCATNWNHRQYQLIDCEGNLDRRHVSPAVAFLANDENSRMSASGLNDQIVQILEVVVVAAEKNPLILNGMQQMNRICLSHESNVGRNLHILACLPQGQN